MYENYPLPNNKVSSGRLSLLPFCKIIFDEDHLHEFEILMPSSLEHVLVVARSALGQGLYFNESFPSSGQWL